MDRGNAALTQKQIAARATRHFNLVKAPVQGTTSGISRDRSKYLLVKEADLQFKQTRPLPFPAVYEELANRVLQCQS